MGLKSGNLEYRYEIWEDTWLIDKDFKSARIIILYDNSLALVKWRYMINYLIKKEDMKNIKALR